MFDWLAAGIAVAGCGGALKAGSAAQEAGAKAAKAVQRAASSAHEAAKRARGCPPGFHSDTYITDHGNGGEVECSKCGRRKWVSA